MSTLFTILIVIVCLLLTLVVLVQNPKGGGLASGFTGAQQFGGVQRTTDFLEKSTWGLVIALMVLSIASASFNDSTLIAAPDAQGTLEQEIQSAPTGAQPGLPAAPAPATPAQDDASELFEEE